MRRGLKQAKAKRERCEMEDVACLLSCCHAWLCDDCIRYISESEFERCIWEGVLRDGVHVGWLVGWLPTWNLLMIDMIELVYMGLG